MTQILEIMGAIERVADKRHARMCAAMPEPEAAALITKYLDHMLNRYKDTPRLVQWIKALKSGYTYR